MLWLRNSLLVELWNLIVTIDPFLNVSSFLPSPKIKCRPPMAIGGNVLQIFPFAIKSTLTFLLQYLDFIIEMSMFHYSFNPLPPLTLVSISSHLATKPCVGQRAPSLPACTTAALHLYWFLKGCKQIHLNIGEEKKYGNKKPILVWAVGSDALSVWCLDIKRRESGFWGPVRPCQ